MLIKNGHIGFALSVVKSEKLNHAKLEHRRNLLVPSEPPALHLLTNRLHHSKYDPQPSNKHKRDKVGLHRGFIYLWILFSEYTKAEKTPLEDTNLGAFHSINENWSDFCPLTVPSSLRWPQICTRFSAPITTHWSTEVWSQSRAKERWWPIFSPVDHQAVNPD